MKTIEELLKNLSRPEVLEFGLVTNRLPSVNIGGKFEPVDDEAPTNERLMQMLVTMGGARYVDSLSDKPVQWTTKLDGVGVIAVAAILRKDIVQARFTVSKRDAAAAPAGSSRSPAATTQPQPAQKPPAPPVPVPAPKPAAAQSSRSIPVPSPTPAQVKPAAAPAAPPRSPGPISSPMTAAKATAQIQPSVIKSVVAQSTTTRAAQPVSQAVPAAPPAPPTPAPAVSAAPPVPAQPVPPPPEEEWDDDDEPTLQTLSPPVVPPHMMPPSIPEAPKAKPARRPDETVTQIDDSTLKGAAKAAQDKIAADKAAAEKAAADKAAADKAAAEKAAAEKAAAEKAAADKAAADKAAAEKAAAEKAAADKAAADKAAADKAAAEKAAAEKAAAEKAAADKAAAEKAAAERAAAERATAERAAAERAAAEKAAADEAAAAEKAAADQAARELAEQEQIAAEQAAAAEAEHAEQERLAAEHAVQEEARAAEERATQERVAHERAAAQQRAVAQAKPAPRRISTPTSLDAVDDVEITTAHAGSKKVSVHADADADGDTVSLPGGGVDVAQAAQQAATQASARGPVPTTTAPTIPEKDRPRVDAAAAIDSFLAMAVAARATDLVIVSGRPVLLRVATDLLPRTQTVSVEQVERIAKDIVPARLRETLEKEGSCDFAVEHLTHGRFRVNVSRQRTGVKLTLRVIAKELPSLAALGLPDAVAAGIRHESGLVVITGPAGHGKSTTLAALVDIINRESAKHVASIEEPIEHVHPRRKSLVSQRDVGLHTRTKARAFHSALRSDPDVVVVNDLRDAESVRLALTAAEGGRLVLGTMNAPSAVIAAERMIRLFGPTEQLWARTALASTLRLIVGQQLVPSADRTRLHAAIELLPASVSLWAAIKFGRLHELAGGNAKGKGVVHLDASLAELVRSQKVTIEVAKQYAESPVDLDALVAGRKS